MNFVLLFARYTIDVFVENDYYTLMQIITGKKYIGNAQTVTESIIYTYVNNVDVCLAVGTNFIIHIPRHIHIIICKYSVFLWKLSKYRYCVVTQ